MFRDIRLRLGNRLGRYRFILEKRDWRSPVISKSPSNWIRELINRVIFRIPNLKSWYKPIVPKVSIWMTCPLSVSTSFPMTSIACITGSSEWERFSQLVNYLNLRGASNSANYWCQSDSKINPVYGIRAIPPNTVRSCLGIDQCRQWHQHLNLNHHW